jgi:hypothetical protein
MKVIDLIQHLQTLPQDLPVYVRMEDPLCEADYWGNLLQRTLSLEK